MKDYASKTGLKVNEKKTEVLGINSKSTKKITIGAKELNDVDKFVYLGATVSNQGGGGEDIVHRINKARASFMKLRPVWGSSHYSLGTKIRLYNSLVKSVLLYGCEAWKVNESDKKKLDTFQFKCFRRIMRIRWPYVVANNEILTRTSTKRISTEVQERRWKWIGHVLRMEDNNHCMTAMTWTPGGKRKVGRPKTTWRRTFK